MSISLTYNDAAARRMTSRVREAMKAVNCASVIKRVADDWQAKMVDLTPKRWTGYTRRGWLVQQTGSYRYELSCSRTRRDMKVMLWLELGTKAHGPKKAKRLFVPLSRKAASAGARGVMEANAAAAAEAKWANYGLAKKKRRKPRLPFVYGKDFVFAKRVKGIKAMHIVRKARPKALRDLKIEMVESIRAALRS